MKKFLLTGFVVVTFALYSFHQRHGDGQTLVKAPPSTGASQTVPSSSSSSSASNSSSSGSGSSGSSSSGSTTSYKDGQYTGSVADAYYGNIQVLVVISGGRITDVKFLQYPNDNNNSAYINSQAMPYLKQEALQAQSANVNVISGATDTSQAFVESLSAALSRAAG